MYSTPDSPTSVGSWKLPIPEDDNEITPYAALFPTDEQDMHWVSPVKTSNPRKRRRKKAEKGRHKKQKLPNEQVSSEEQRASSETDPFHSQELEPIIDGLEDGMVSDDDDGKFEAYIRLVEAGCVAFVRITRFIYVVQGWDSKQRAGTMHWFHMETRDKVECLCPAGESPQFCMHARYYQEFCEEKFLVEDHHWAADTRTVRFWRELTGYDENIWLNMFSVESHTGGLKARALVTYEGTDSGWGKWQCSKHRDERNCAHETQARKLLQAVIGDEHWDSEHPIRIPEEGDKSSHFVVAEQVSQEPAISYLPIMPPRWASLPTDTMHYARSDPSLDIPPLISLVKGHGSASCKGRPGFSEDAPKVLRDCTVYTLTGTLLRQLEVQICPKCPRRHHCYIGPDGRELGLFNYNNSVLFTHELLDEFTSRCSSSETPFAAFTQAISRVYEGRGTRFVGEDLFRSAWFAFVSIQDLGDDMKCPKCGDVPENVIWDGVTLAFGKKHLKDTLKPPTTIEEGAPVRHRRYSNHNQWFPSQGQEKGIRKLLAGWLHSKRASLHRNKADTNLDTTFVTQQNTIIAVLGVSAPDVGALFRSVFVDERKRESRLLERYVLLFEQLSAEESAVQMVTASALEKLKCFVKSPSQKNASRLLEIPVLMKIIEEEMGVQGACPEVLLRLCKWMCDRVDHVLMTLKSGDLPALKEKRDASASDDWKLTGCCYGLPQIRLRPKYPLLKGDGAPEVENGRGDKCSKYYSTYGERRLTGGIMCSWCTHSVCYGFHCIPKGEGRNDVFSAMITRWPKAPRRVIYDFACALGPYCMTREPEFFANTQFLIDGFHAKGHTKCSSASFLSTYAEVDAGLSRVNSSAAECGNSGIGRIRKSVSYMRQNRAILFTKVFVSIWNRLRIRTMNGTV